MVRTTWRSAYRAKTSLGRRPRAHATPLYQIDRLIDQHDIRPVTEERLAKVARDALERLLKAAEDNDRVGYPAGERNLKAALTAVQHLRYLRYGRSVSNHDAGDEEPARRPRWW